MAESEASSVAKACGSCAKSKAKCDWPTTAIRCHRCTRLSKECVPQDSIRKRKAPKIRRGVQIAQLEEKVNSLLSVIGTDRQAPTQQPSSGPSSLTTSAISVSTPSEETGSLGQTTASLPSQQVVRGLPYGLPSILTVEFGPNDPGILVDDPDAMLSIFQKRMASQVPFVVIPQSTTAAYLRQKTPFVYMAVMMVASFEDARFQLALGKKILEHMTERLILHGEKSMDLLQGLLIYISWYHYLLATNHQLSNLLGLISALFVDLGLKRVSAENEVNEAFIQITRRTQGHAPPPEHLNLDQQRALLGCYYLSSCLTSSFSRMDPLRFTPFVAECCESIAQAQEHETDIDLSSWLKLQSLVEKQRLSGLWEGFDPHNPTARAPVTMMVRSFQIELLDFKNTLSNDQLCNPWFTINYYSAEIHLYEVCFKMSPSTGVDYSMDSLRLVDIIHCCFEATRSFFDLFLSVSASCYCTLTIVNAGQMFHALGALYKLSIFDIAGWDVHRVRKSLDLSAVLNQISMCGEAVGNTYGINPFQENPWFFVSRKLRTLQSWWVAKLEQEVDLTAASRMAQDPAFDDLQAMMNFDFLDENLWKSTLA